MIPRNLGADINGAQRMNPNAFDQLLTLLQTCWVKM